MCLHGKHQKETPVQEQIEQKQIHASMLQGQIWNQDSRLIPGVHSRQNVSPCQSCLVSR